MFSKFMFILFVHFYIHPLRVSLVGYAARSGTGIGPLYFPKATSKSGYEIIIHM